MSVPARIKKVHLPERSLDMEVQFLKGVGPKNARALQKLNLFTVQNLLFHIPRRYEDRRQLPPISEVRPGQWVTIRGKIARVDSRPVSGGRIVLSATIRDRSGAISLVWFNQPWIARQLSDGHGEIVAYGQVKESSRCYEIHSPEFEVLSEEDDADEFARIVPVYPLTEGLMQRVVRRAVRSAVDHFLDLVQDPLPMEVLEGNDLNKLPWCLKQIHQPQSEEARLEARKRLVFEEFFYMQVSLALRRAEIKEELGISFPISKLVAGSISQDGGFEAGLGEATATDLRVMEPRNAAGSPIPASAVQELRAVESHLFAGDLAVKRDSEPLWDQIREMLPFELTKAQFRVINEIFRDMERPHPMNRLLQGDVGSGKTAVGACAILAAVRSGFQAVLMAPTEILAEQHAASLKQIFEPLGLDVELLVGKLTPTQKKRAASRTASGLAHIAVGTHALIQEGVGFANLGLVVIDEQHKFGVMQRKAIRDKGLGNPDVLVMTATPIPRSLTMTRFGDLDVSVIDELPPGRKAIKTHWKAPYEREAVYSAVRDLISKGRQAYFVCPMVSESEKMLAQAAEELHARLSESVFPDLRVGLLHGQMKPKEKEQIMERFRAHELEILVSTTVIEVGVDVPNATVMVVEDANRFGLSQLHQLRGRVGRGAFQSYAILIADAKSEESRKRMEVMVETCDGFRIAEEDLKLRGPGELAGTKQSGNLDFKIADIIQDALMLERAREAAIELVRADPRMQKPENVGILEKIRQQRSETAVITVS